MALCQLPNEILQCIFEHIFPARWGCLSSKDTRKDLVLRLVCSEYLLPTFYLFKSPQFLLRSPLFECHLTA